MIRHLQAHAQIIYQRPDSEQDLPEPAIALYTDATPLIVIVQEDREIVINLATVPELCKALKSVAGLASA